MRFQYINAVHFELMYCDRLLSHISSIFIFFKCYEISLAVIDSAWCICCIYCLYIITVCYVCMYVSKIVYFVLTCLQFYLQRKYRLLIQVKIFIKYTCYFYALLYVLPREKKKEKKLRALSRYCTNSSNVCFVLISLYRLVQ